MGWPANHQGDSRLVVRNPRGLTVAISLHAAPYQYHCDHQGGILDAFPSDPARLALAQPHSLYLVGDLPTVGQGSMTLCLW